MVKCTLNPNCAEILSHLVHAKGGGGSYMTPRLISGHSGHRGTNYKANDQVLKEINVEQFF